LETQAIKKVFDDYACKVPISSTKSYGVRIRLELLTNCNPERINY